MNLISGKGETSSRLPAFSLFLPGSCPNYRDRRKKRIKKWRRTWKLELIERHNRQWRDLYEELA
jgi:putative endonuclease